MYVRREIILHMCWGTAGGRGLPSAIVGWLHGQPKSNARKRACKRNTLRTVPLLSLPCPLSLTCPLSLCLCSCACPLSLALSCACPLPLALSHSLALSHCVCVLALALSHLPSVLSLALSHLPSLTCPCPPGLEARRQQVEAASKPGPGVGGRDAGAQVLYRHRGFEGRAHTT